MRILWPMLAAVISCGCSFHSESKPELFAFFSPACPSRTNASANIVALTRVSISPLFQHRSFTYRTAENTYKRDPYACFMIPPERGLAESIRALMMEGGAFGCVLDPGSSLTPAMAAEVFINELCGDFRQSSRPVGTLGIHFVCYQLEDGHPGRVLLDKLCAHSTPLGAKTSTALMAAWDNDLREIMKEINAEFAKTIQPTSN